MHPERFQNASPETVYEGKFLRFINKAGWEYVERNNCDGIVIILSQTEDQKIIFVEQYRPPVGRNVVEFPAGLINDERFESTDFKEETIIGAAEREFFEETGYKADHIKPVFQGPINSGISSDMFTMVIATGIQRVGPGGGDGNEVISVHTVPLPEVDYWLDQKSAEGCLIGPRIYAGLYLLKKYNN
jgi:ADP-ribose pyrophosphatase